MYIFEVFVVFFLAPECVIVLMSNGQVGNTYVDCSLESTLVDELLVIYGGGLQFTTDFFSFYFTHFI